MIARTAAVVEYGGVLGELACAPPLTLRQVHGEVPGRCELRLVGTAAGPLPGDDLSISLHLLAGARAALRATGASLAQGRGSSGDGSRGDAGRGGDGPGGCAGDGPGGCGGGGPGDRGGDRGGGCGGDGPGDRGGDRGGGAAALTIRADLADGTDLVADPGPLIVCRGSRVDVSVELSLGLRAAVDWRELIVLGRSGEPAGAVTLRWDVTRLGRPVLRQFVDLADPALTGWGGLTAGRRVLACALIADPEGTPRTVVASPTSVAQRLDDQTLLVTVLGDDAAGATRELGDLCARARS